MGRNASGKRPIVIKKYITNNDNRVTNITYNVRTTDKKPAREWIDEKTELPKTNVARVNWEKARGKWTVQVVDAETRRQKRPRLRKLPPLPRDPPPSQGGDRQVGRADVAAGLQVSLTLMQDGFNTWTN